MEHFITEHWMFFVQFLGFLGFCISVLRLQMRRVLVMRGFNTVSSGIFAIHYILGALPAGLLCGVSSVRSLMLLHPAIWPLRHYIIGAAMVLSGVISVYIFESWYDLLPLFGVWVGSLIDFQSCALRVRGLGVFGNLIWVTYNVIVGSYGGITNSIFKLCSNALGYYRHHVLPFKKQSTGIK